MQVLKTLKRVAAIGTGVAMLGATLTGALALDLKDYPAPFVSAAGVYDDSNVFVYGDSAIAADTVAISDISTSLQFMAKTPVVTGGGSVTVTGGESAKVPLGQGFANSTYLDPQLQDDDISTLFDGIINFQGKEYDTSEELQLCDADGRKYGEPYASTSLMLPDDDFKSNVYFTLGKDKIKYAYKFDETIAANKTTTTNPLEIEFLGKKLKITSIPVAGNEITTTVGDEYSMKEGDSVTVEGKTVKLNAVSSTNVALEVDGVAKSINSGSTSTVNSIEIYVDSVMSKTNLGESSAILVIGLQATETYTDGDAYVGEDTNNPNWVWDIEAMSTSGVSTTSDDCGTDATESNVLRIENDFEMYDLGDNPTGVGQCIDLPNKFLSICFDSLTVADTDYTTYTMDFDLNSDFDAAHCAAGTGATSTADAIHLSTDASEGFDLRAFTNGAQVVANVTGNVKSKDVWLFTSGKLCNGTDDAWANTTSPWLHVFYKSTDSGQPVKFFGAVATGNTVRGGNTSGVTALARANYGNTKDSNMILYLQNNVGSTNDLNLTWRFVADTSGDLNGAEENIFTRWGLTSGNLTALGATSGGDAEATEVEWVPGRFTRAYLGTKDEDHRTAYGVIIKDPKGNSGSDKVVLSVPNDQVFANVVVKGTAAKVTSGSTSYVPTKVSPVHMAASAVTAPTSYNLIVVGGPCANPLAESVFGQTCDGWAFAEGEALVKLVANGEKVALLVAGTSALDTQRAGKALAAYDKYAFSGTERLVKGATLSDITVEGVAAPVAAAAAEEVAAA